MEEHDIAMNKAKIALMNRADSAFFTTICFSLVHKWDPNIPTAATNGKQIRFNPQFFMTLSTEERVFLLLHESMHCAYLHMSRLQGRDMRKWNVAADYVINLQLVDRGFTMPSVGLLDRQYAGMSTEQVYDALPDCQNVQVQLDLEPAEGDEEDLQQDIQDILVRAQIQSKLSGDKPGTIPGDIEIFLRKLLDPKLPWNQILAKYLNSFAKNDYTFKKPNRRFFPKHHLPSMHSEALGEIAIAIDTSGSVTDEEFHRFVSETHSILRMMNPEQISLIQFDTDIKSVDTVRSVMELMRVKFTGRGGTYIEPVMDWAIANKPQVMLVFSDGYFNMPQSYPKNPILWMIHNNESFEAPIGKVVHYDME